MVNAYLGRGRAMAFLRRKSKKKQAQLAGMMEPAEQDGFQPPMASPAPAQHAAPDYSNLTVGDYANGMPNIRLSEMVKSFMRQLRWVVPLFVIGSLGAWYLTKDFKRTYSGDGRIMVQLSDEYVYQPITGNAGGAGLMQTPDNITLNEVAIMKNGEMIDRVIGEMTSALTTMNGRELTERQAQSRFAKEAFAKIKGAKSERERQDAWMELRKEVDSSFVVMPRPKSSIIDLVYNHENPEVAVETLNKFIDAYMSFRRDIFVEGSGDVISERRAATEAQLAQNERAIARFMTKNDISNFDSENKGLSERSEKLKADLNGLRAQIVETEASLSKVEDQLRQTDSTIDLYVDDRASQRVAQAELELKQLLAKYLPTSNPVRQKRVELQELKSLQSSYNGKAAGGRRVGPNPVQQALVTQRNTLQAAADSYREKEFTLQRQLNSADAKLRRLTGLYPTLQNLMRERDTLATRLNTYNTKEQEALVNQSQAEANSENIRVISYAKYPNKGRNMRLMMFALASMGWGLMLFMIACLRVFLDPRLYAVPSAGGRARNGGDRRAAEESYVPGHIPEPVAPYAPAAPLPASAPAYAPSYAPAAATPAYYATGTDGGGYAQTAYDASQGAGQGYADYGQTGAPYAQDSYAQDYGQPYSQPQASSELAPYMQSQSQNMPSGMTEWTPSPDANPYPSGTSDLMPGYADVSGNAALDYAQNPYLSGQSSAQIDNPYAAQTQGLPVLGTLPPAPDA